MKIKSPPFSPSPASQPSDSAGEQPFDEEFMRITEHVPDAISDNPDAAPEAKEEIEAIPAAVVASALEPTFEAAFHMVAKVRGPHWELAQFEKMALVKGWTPIVQLMLAKLGKSEQVLFALALMPTMAIIGGKAAQDIKLGSSRASIRTPESEASSVSSASAAPARPPEPSGSFVEQSE